MIILCVLLLFLGFEIVFRFVKLTTEQQACVYVCTRVCFPGQCAEGQHFSSCFSLFRRTFEALVVAAVVVVVQEEEEEEVVAAGEESVPAGLMESRKCV